MVQVLERLRLLCLVADLVADLVTDLAAGLVAGLAAGLVAGLAAGLVDSLVVEELLLQDHALVVEHLNGHDNYLLFVLYNE